MVRVTGRQGILSIRVVRDNLFQILHLSQPLEASEDGSGKVIESSGAIWMARGTKCEGLIEVCDSLFQILHPFQLPKANVNGARDITEKSRAVWVARRKKGESLTEVHDSILQILHL